MLPSALLHCEESKKWLIHFLRKRRVIVISGPTACGKTRLAIEVAQALGGEIISADSVQVYRGMDIGTAKPTLCERKGITHHLIDVCELTDLFSVVQFYEQAIVAIQEIFSRRRVPIIVGGTGFYLRALLYGPPQGPPASDAVRKKLKLQIDQLGLDMLYARLVAFDPQYARGVHRRDERRIIRSLEIIALTGKKVSDFPQRMPSLALPSSHCYFLYFPKDALAVRIEMRCDAMVASGLVDEVQHLDSKGLKDNPAAARAIGYRQCLAFLDSARTAEDWTQFVWQFKRASKKYAKRQLTWFRQYPCFRWVSCAEHTRQHVLEMICLDYIKNGS